MQIFPQIVYVQDSVYIFVPLLDTAFYLFFKQARRHKNRRKGN